MLAKITTLAVALLMAAECSAVQTERLRKSRGYSRDYSIRARVNRQSRNFKDGDLFYAKCDMGKNMALNEVRHKLPFWVYRSNIKITMMLESIYNDDGSDFFESANVLAKLENLDFEWDLEPSTTYTATSHPQLQIVSHYDEDYDVSSCTTSDKLVQSSFSSTNYVGYDPTKGRREQEEEQSFDTPVVVALGSAPTTVGDPVEDDFLHSFDHRQIVAELQLLSWDITAANTNYGTDENGDDVVQIQDPLVVGCCRWGHMDQKSALRFYNRYFGTTQVSPPEGLKETMSCEEQLASNWYGVEGFPKYAALLEYQQPTANCPQVPPKPP